MSLAKKLKEVVAANFVEISRQDKDGEPVREAQHALPRAAEDALGWDPAAAAPREREEELLLPAESNEAFYAAGSDGPAATAEDVRASQDAAGADAEQEAAPAAADPLSLVGENGAVDFDGVYARVDVPRSTAFTAEQALSMLLSMPSDLPLRVKRLTVKATLDAVGQAVGAAPADIVADAERKKDGLERYVEELAAHVAGVRAARETEIARLRACIADIEAEVVGTEKKRDAAVASARDRADQFDQVVAFFTAGAAEEAASEQAGTGEHADDAELPPYLQEEAVLRLLGINSGPEGAETAGRAVESAA